MADQQTPPRRRRMAEAIANATEDVWNRAYERGKAQGAAEMLDQCAAVCDARGDTIRAEHGRNVAASVEAYRCRDAILAQRAAPVDAEDSHHG